MQACDRNVPMNKLVSYCAWGNIRALGSLDAADSSCVLTLASADDSNSNLEIRSDASMWKGHAGILSPLHMPQPLPLTRRGGGREDRFPKG